MKRVLPLLAALLATTLAHAATGPIRVLHLGQAKTDSARHAHVWMRDLGREAIWFDYTADTAVVTPEWVAKFDLVLLEAPRGGFPALAGVEAKKIVIVPGGEELTRVQSVREAILTAVGDARKRDWEAFLAQREPEQREPNPNVANYEGRPEPISFVQPLSVKGTRERTQVAPDLRLELFASEPDIAKPIALAWDDRGRCWIAETRDYPHNVQKSGVGNDSIKICEDTDGDGKADKFTVFADKLNIPTSLVFANGGLIVAQPPRFLFLKDTDGDDRADVRQEIMTGWGIGDTHAQANNLHYGHDNWLYGCVGYSGFNGEVGGASKQFSMGTYRFKADGSALEFLHQFSNNSWGHSANEFGDQFGGTANNAPIFYGGIPASIVPKGLRVMSAKRINQEDKCHTITPNFRQVDVLGGYTAAAGSAFIYSSNLPARLQGKAMVCEPTMKVIALMDVQREGAGYTAKDGFNLVASSDEWMSPVFAEVGPDGAVWFADWQNFIIQHNPTPSVSRGGYDAKTGVGGAHENPLRDHARGRIFRVVWERAQPPAIRSLAGASTEQLVQALNHDNPFWRLTAQQKLVEGKKTEAAPELRKKVTARSGVAAIHALWTLQGLGQLDESTHRTALLAQDSGLRRTAVRALGNDPAALALFFSSGVVSDSDWLTRKAALVKLAEFPTTTEIQTLAVSVSRNPQHRSDEWLNQAVRLLVRKHQAEIHQEGPNLLPNPSLELIGADGLPEGWKRRDYGRTSANEQATWSTLNGTGLAHSGEKAVKCVAPNAEADTSLFADVTYKPDTEYRLSAWVKGGRGLRGKLSLNDHLNRTETEVVGRESEWTEVETTFNSKNTTRGSINILFVARGKGYFDDVKLAELLPAEDGVTSLTAGNPENGKQIFYQHAAACVLCHQVQGIGSTVGPALDGIATRGTKEYLRESMVEPSKVIAKGYESLGTISPMPPMTDIFSPQQLEDILAFLQTLN